MIATIDSKWWQVTGTAIVALVAVRAYARERRELDDQNSERLWPMFWLLTALLLAAMAVGHGGDIGGRIADLGRREARTAGWYADRRTLQVPLVAVIAATWFTLSWTAILRFPERRRRYLPSALAVLSLICFVGIRMVSLHHIDWLLRDVHLVGIEFGFVVEFMLLLLIVALVERALRQLDDSGPPHRPLSNAGAPWSP